MANIKGQRHSSQGVELVTTLRSILPTPSNQTTSIGNKGVPGLLAHLGLNPDWSILDKRMSSDTCAIRVCSITSVVANQRGKTSDCV